MKSRSEKLGAGLRRVNLMCLASIVVLLTACGPSPRAIPAGMTSTYATTLGNARRAGYENEAVTDSPAVAWDMNAGSGIRGTLLLLDSAVLVGTTNRQMLAFHTQTGRRYWDQRFRGAVTSSVLYDSRALYIATADLDGELYALDLSRGKRRWRERVGPVRFTPLLDNGMIYFGTDRGMVGALQTTNGSRQWRTTIGAGIAATLLDAGSNIIAFTSADSMFALRKSDGAIVTRGTIPATPSAAPAVFESTIVVPTHQGAVLGVDLNTFEVRWRVETGAPVLTAPAVASDGTAYVASRAGHVYRIRDGQGEKIAEAGHSVSSSLTLARDRLLLGSYDGTLTVLSTDGQLKWQWRLDDSIVTPVAVRNGAVFVPLLRGRIVKLR